MEDKFKTSIKTFAIERLKFDDCRFTGSRVDETIPLYEKWLKEGNHGEMTYLENHLKFKQNPELLLKSARSAIVVIKNYKNTKTRNLEGDLKVARYAAGEDYHLVMTEKLKELTAFIKNLDKTIECYSGVDSRPLPERALALKAGIGFLGKNSMVIKPGLGSYFFIGIILTTTSLEEDRPLSWNCGQCRLCLDACPTNALGEGFAFNATKCISYMTIEKKTPLTGEELKQTNGWIFGCDICQEVCPYNHDNITLTDWPQFLPSNGIGFDFKTDSIPKNTALYRSRKRLLANVNNLKR
ncbi:MAG: tRNA epoxyqueuosine(34) reductase QueG [Omnitrophica WOR_2 bacterium GWA2_47_8]|nr:MAG: tRNA epoxyqueuosine(34) reductase QueG [Omnitrophica WOR_2 bacterium GWA2_47_8]